MMRKAILSLCSLYLASCACYYEDIRREGGEEALNPTSCVYDLCLTSMKILREALSLTEEWAKA